MTDLISDMLTRIRNAQQGGHQKVIIPFSRIKFELAKILEREGFIERIKQRGNTPKKKIEIQLKYDQGMPGIHEIKRISKPGCRIYKPTSKLFPVKQGRGIAIISTPQGLMIDREARKKKIGGEVVCEIW